VRNKSAVGVIAVDYKTIDDTAKKGHDYATSEQPVKFDDTEVCELFLNY
jgi:hypothetical protein